MPGRPFRSALLALTLAVAASCSSGDTPTDPGDDDGLAKYTVMVYMAADNNLSVAGIFDIDEMESAGVDPNVNIVVQAEFSPTMLAQYECDASCFNRPNFNTFRYVLTGQGATKTGPNGATTDIGNRNMTLTSELVEFINWAKATKPAEHYILVLWNHGGGYTGLLQDETSAGNNLMSLDAVKAALASTGKVDILDFDMCLMGGYETLLSMQGLADYVVFSEEVVPGEGNPYKQWVDAVQANKNASAATMATAMVDAFHGFYVTPNHQSSTTKSAYAMDGFAAFNTALTALATTLKAELATERPNVNAALTHAQKYTYPELTDIVTLLDTLNVKTSNTTIKSQIAAVRTAATSATFRLHNRVRNGTGGTTAAAANVLRSTGMHMVLPSGVGDDRFNNSGPRSYAAYAALYPTAAWTSFLSDWLNAQTPADAYDQGSNVFQGFLVWDEGAVAVGADVDLWILEPNGNLYAPWMGTVTPNGTLTNDSVEDEVPLEGYLTNRYIQTGQYKFYAHLYSDPQNFKPRYDFAYRNGLSSAFNYLYAPTFPTLSMQTSILNDAGATLAKVELGTYTDFQYVAVMTISADPPVRADNTVMLRAPSADAALRADGGPTITPAQWQRLREALAARHAAGVQRDAEARTFDATQPFARRTVPSGLANLFPPRPQSPSPEEQR